MLHDLLRRPAMQRPDRLAARAHPARPWARRRGMANMAQVGRRLLWTTKDSESRFEDGSLRHVPEPLLLPVEHALFQRLQLFRNRRFDQHTNRSEERRVG